MNRQKDKMKIVSFAKSKYTILTNEFDPFDDCIALYVNVDGDNCTITDDGYTDYNLSCLGKNNDKMSNIVVKGKVSDLANLIQEELDKILQAYKVLTK